jgi:uncharacterized protein with GYD domain
MAWYMVQATYSPNAWEAQLKNPRNRFEDLKTMFEPFGAKLHHMWYCFGEYDVVLIAEIDGNVDAAATVLSAASTSALKSLRTTPLMTVDEGIEAVTKAGQIAYRPPSTG